MAELTRAVNLLYIFIKSSVIPVCSDIVRFPGTVYECMRV